MEARSDAWRKAPGSLYGRARCCPCNSGAAAADRFLSREGMMMQRQRQRRALFLSWERVTTKHRGCGGKTNIRYKPDARGDPDFATGTLYCCKCGKDLRAEDCIARI